MSEHYDPDIQAMKDYEALNADTALQLNKAQQEIERLREELRVQVKAAIDAEIEALDEAKRLRAALERTHELIKQGRYHAADAELEALRDE